ncbi:MAG: pyridoxal phosphate-dependent aminotransferase [Actinomycetota bacterium]|nr:pyridoxal phosphate-dependent aminotransferase [Actinomycetota bacterium]
MILGPQVDFDDLYSAVYAVIDDAKTRHRVAKLYKGSHGSTDPRPVVLDFGAFFAAERRGVLGFACQAVRPSAERFTVDDLGEFDRHHAPRVSTCAAFDLLAASEARLGESPADYLTHVATRRHRLGAYRGGSSGFDDESRALAAAYFGQLGIPTAPGEVIVFCGGFKGALLCACAAVMVLRRGDELCHTGGVVLAPVGYYQSLRLIPPIFTGDLEVVEELDGPAVAAWLSCTAHRSGRVVYVPLVNNSDGRVLSRPRARSIAAAVLEHNRRQPANPVWVVADDVYAGSYLAPGLTPQPIGGVHGRDVGDFELGAMSDWTVTITTSSKTVALPTARVAFATTTSAAMRAALLHYRTVFSFGRVPQTGELTAAAALCLTPQSWVEDWNAEYRRRLGCLTESLGAINRELGYELYRADESEGGWYFTLRIRRCRLPRPVASGVHASALLLNYAPHRHDSGVGLLPGELFGHDLDGTDEWLTLRGTLAVEPGELRLFAARLREVAILLRGPDGVSVVRHALATAAAVADLDRIVSQRRF